MGKTYILVVIGILLAKGLGFFRDIIFASAFGASVYTDMYFQIFGLVNLIFTGIGVALSTLVIKNINKIKPADVRARREYVSYFISKTFIISVLAMLGLYAVSGHIVKILLPGLDIYHFNFAIKLMRIMLPSLVFVLTAYVISGVLQNSGVFFITSVMSLPFNIIIIASLIFPEPDITMVSIVTTLGWFLHIIILLPSFYKKGYSLFDFKLKNKFRSGGGEMMYIFISNMLFQLCFTIDKAFVSIESGAASTLNYASNLFVTISSIFVVAMSNVVFPSISKSYELGNISYVKSLTQYIIKLMIAIFLPFILSVCFFGENIISLLYERGEFTSVHTKDTALLFAIYACGFLGYVCQEFFNKILYLDGRYKHTVIGTVVILALKPLVNIIALAAGGVYAVAVSTSLMLTAYGISVLVSLSSLVGSYIRALLRDILGIAVAAAAAVLVYLIFARFMPNIAFGKFSFVIVLGACGAAYLAFLVVTGVFKKLLLGQRAGERSE